jgi:hypothetical protein
VTAYLPVRPFAAVELIDCPRPRANGSNRPIAAICWIEASTPAESSNRRFSDVPEHASKYTMSNVLWESK